MNFWVECYYILYELLKFCCFLEEFDYELCCVECCFWKNEIGYVSCIFVYDFEEG